MIMRIFFFLLSAILGSWLITAVAWGLSIEFKPEAEVDSPVLKLGDVAIISPAQAAEKYSAMPLFKLNHNNALKVYRSSTLKAYVHQGLGRNQKISWAGAEKVTVRRSGGELIDEQVMQTLIEDYLVQHFDHPSVSRIEFVPGVMPKPFIVQSENWDCTVRPSNSNVISARRFSLVFRQDNSVVRNVTAQGKVNVLAKVAVAARDLHRDESIHQDDVLMQQRELSRLEGAVFDLQQALGKQVRHFLGAGSVIDAQKIKRPNLVRRNNKVTLIARKGNMQIIALGVAQEDGAKMDRVCVQNLNSGQEVFGRVLAQDIVEVMF